MAAGSLAFLAGILALQVREGLPSAAWLPAVVAGGGLAAALAGGLHRAGHGRHARVAGLSAWVLAGVAWSLADAQAWRAAALPAALEGRDLVLVGRVAGLPEPRPHGVRFRFRPERVAGPDGRPLPVPGDLRLAWFGQPPRLVPGERWRLVARLRRPGGFANPGGFRYEDWLYRHRYAATGYVRAAHRARRLGPPEGFPIERARLALRERLEGVLAASRLRGPLLGLALGDRSTMTPVQWQVLRATGTAHLLAISGLHIGLVAGLAFGAVRLAWAAVPPLARRFPATGPAAVAALAAGGLYAALAGFTVPTQRALLMLAVGLVALVGGRGRDPGRAPGLALLAALALDPRSALDPGLWLSFGAVALILLAVARQPRPRGWRGAVRVQWAVGLGLAPAGLLLFQQASIVGLGVNLLAIPWTGIAVVPPLLAGTIGLGLGMPGAGVLVGLAERALGALWGALEQAASLPAAQWLGSRPPLWAAVLAAGGIALALLPRAFPGRRLWPVLLVPLLAVRPERPPAGEAWVTVLDVGQGLAVVVETARHALLYDTGGRVGQLDAGAAAVVPFLRSRGIRRLDVVVVSHGDTDHRAGLEAVRAALPVDRVVSGVPWQVPGSVPCRAGMGWRWDGVRFEVLHPERPRRGRGNDGSCVLRVAAGSTALLLPGDLEARGERALLRGVPAARLRATVLVSPHHGSAGASTAAFVAAVRPRWVVHAAGSPNRYRFPRPRTVARYAAAGAAQLVTGETGAVRLVLRPAGVAGPWCERAHGARFWRRRSPPGCAASP